MAEELEYDVVLNSVSVPWHSKDLKRGTFRRIIKDAGLSVEEFLELLS